MPEYLPTKSMLPIAFPVVVALSLVGRLRPGAQVDARPPVMLIAYLFGRRVGAARLVLSVIVGGPSGFAWLLTSHSPLGTEQRQGGAAAGAVEDALSDRWPLG